MAMTASQLKERLAELLEVDKKEADNVLWAFGEICTEVVKKADTVTFPGLGKLSCVVAPARNARNPKTGESIKVPAKVAVKFKLSKPLKDSAPSINSKRAKKLLEEAEVKQAAAAKRKRKRDKEAAAAEEKTNKTKKKKKSSTEKVEKTGKKKKKKSSSNRT